MPSGALTQEGPGLNQPDKKFEPIWAVGFMTGTSVDAVDAAMLLTDGEVIVDFGPTAEVQYSAEERAIVMDAITAARAWNFNGKEPRAAFALAERIAVGLHAQALGQLLAKWDGPTPSIAGVHGQTVLHRRPTPDKKGATRQIINPKAMFQSLGLPLAYDFRSADVRAGGEGAPLAPAYHAARMQHLDVPTVVLNLGGVANITAVDGEGNLIAFDTGPANGPIDEWVERHHAGSFDKDGALAAAGTVDEERLKLWLDKPYFAEAWPKSLDRFDFNAALADGLSLEDGAATLTALSARGVSLGIEKLPLKPEQIIACGGGRHNPALMAQLAEEIDANVVTAETVGWKGDSTEAEAFAFLAVRTLRGLPISWPGTTGANTPMNGGKTLS
ncbi:MAG: anhydro-N-acetylmuramic acid kinase [Pseudomonadota bacterium]